MLPFALNHMTAPTRDWRGLLDLASRLGCCGVEFRNDLPGPLFGGDDPAEVRAAAKSQGLRILALAEVKRFNDWSEEKAQETDALIAIAKACGAEAITLIPRNDGVDCSPDQSRKACLTALQEILPRLQAQDMRAVVEPLGFEISSLRDKAILADVITGLGGEAHLSMVHDTFHHALAGFGPIFPELTGIVHISGVTAPLSLAQMTDADRVLVGPDDLLANLGQLRALAQAGYHGPLSYECFAPSIHALPDPHTSLQASMAYLRAGLAA